MSRPLRCPSPGIRCLLTLVLAVAVTGSAAADPLRHPLAVRNHNPFVAVYGIPAMDAVEVLDQGGNRLALTLDATSNFTDDGTDNEFIAIDGETYRLNLRYTRGFADGWEAGVELPLLRHNGGFLDGFIINWHDFFGFPQGGRDETERDRLEYRYTTGGSDLVAVDAADSGVGDVAIHVGRRLVGRDRHPRRRLALRAQLKAPTGDSDRLFGSGGWDVALWLQAQHHWRERLWWSAGAGVTYLGRGDVLPDLQRHLVGVLSLGAGWQPWQRLSLQLQTDLQSPAYQDTPLGQLSDTAVQISIGGSLGLTERLFLDFAVVENEFTPDASPDVSFHLRLRTRF